MTAASLVRRGRGVEVDAMKSTAIVALFQASLTCIWAAVLVGSSPVSVLAGSAQTQSGAATATEIGTVVSATAPNPGASAASAVPSQIDGAELLSPVKRRIYQRAASAFTVFCHDWEHLLHEREVDNLEHLSWRKDGDLEIATYTGYGKVESCECKASKEGLPIGKISYEEINYSIAGKTINEARHAIPKLMHEIKTLEIFSWDKDKWFY